MAMDERRQGLARLARQLDRPVSFMEVCGTHTVNARRCGLHTMLPTNVSLRSGPGCPVCVTPPAYIDRAIRIALRGDTAVVTFGDLLKVPGTTGTLADARARGGDVRVAGSPAAVLAMAQAQPGRRFVFLGIGFETTTPGVAWTILQAHEKEIGNVSVLCAHKTVPEVLGLLPAQDDVAIDGFLCPGHVSVITGAAIYRPVAQAGTPCVIAGFEPSDMLHAVEMLLRQRVEGKAAVQIQYARAVSQEGNPCATKIMNEVFEPCTADWRGLGAIAGSGLAIREAYARFDAARLYAEATEEFGGIPSSCRCGDVLRGACEPPDCSAFGAACKPVHPLGPCMVSTEGACAAYYRFPAQEDRIGHAG